MVVMTVNHEEIIGTRTGGVYEICINRPKKRNALTHAMYGALLEHLLAADRDDEVRVLVLRSTHEHFTAGNDLKDFLETEFTEEANAMKFLLAIATARKPIVCAVGGAAVGIGTTLLLHCDLVYAADTSRFAVPFVQLGLTPEGGSSKLLAMRCGQGRAVDWLLTGRTFDAKEALEAGFVSRIFASVEETWEAANQAATALATKSTDLLIQTKQMIRPMPIEETVALLREEARILAARLKTDEAREAISGFFAR